MWTCTLLLFGFCVQQAVLIFSWMCVPFFEFSAALYVVPVITHTHIDVINSPSCTLVSS